jgi:hypothetical protein
MLFGKYRLSLVKAVFDVDTQTAAAYYGVSIYTWRAYASGRRVPPDDLIVRIEDDIVKHFKQFIPLKKHPS